MTFIDRKTNNASDNYIEFPFSHVAVQKIIVGFLDLTPDKHFLKDFTVLHTF